MDHFEFVFPIGQLANIMETTHGLSTLLQSKKCDLNKAANLVQTAYESLHELRVKFDELPKTAAHIVKMWRTSQQFQDRIVPKVLKFVDGLCEDERLSCA